MKQSLGGWALLLTLSTITFSFGQTATTSLRGIIKDPSGALLPGAKITIVNRSAGISFNATANSAGLYTFAQIPPAKYTITATAAGFGDLSMHGGNRLACQRKGQILAPPDEEGERINRQVPDGVPAVEGTDQKPHGAGGSD